MLHDGRDHPCLCTELPNEPPRQERDEAVDEARRGLPISRRSIMAGLGAAGGLAMMPGMAKAAGPGRRRGQGPRQGLELVLLGTLAGPPVETAQAGISSALVVDGRTYVIDCGRSSVTQFAAAGLRFDSIEGVFLPRGSCRGLLQLLHAEQQHREYAWGPTGTPGPGLWPRISRRAPSQVRRRRIADGEPGQPGAGNGGDDEGVARGLCLQPQHLPA